MNIFIVAHYNLNNGDRAVLQATLDKFFDIFPYPNITVSVFDPSTFIDARVKIVGWPLNNKIAYKCLKFFLEKGLYKGINFVAKHFSEKSYLRELNMSDVVFVSGGHHLTDILGKDTFYLLASNFIVPLMKEKPTYLLPQSIGPIADNKAEQNLLYFLLSKVKRIAYRDEVSRKFLEERNLLDTAEYVPDIVFSLKNASNQSAEKKTIGVALYCVYKGEKKEKLFPYVIENLYETLRIFAMEGYDIHFISMDINDTEVANSLVERLASEFDNILIQVDKPETENVVDIVKLFTGKDFILAYKTHSVVFSILNSIPVVAIAYHPKTIDFMASIGLEEFAINDTEANCKTLISLAKKVISNSDRIKQLEQIGTQKNTILIDNYLKSILHEDILK